MSTQRKAPISARHSFALAFDLAVRRDALQSLWVPLLLHTPFLLIKAFVPAPDDPGGLAVRNLQLNSLQLLGDLPVSLLVASMLRFRALSAFQAGPGAPLAGVLVCYARGARRMAWLFFTELLRNAAILAGVVFGVLPGVWLGFRLSLATEAVVLRRTGVAGAFARSFQLTPARLERWLEMTAISVMLVLGVLFTCALGFLTVRTTAWSTWVTVALFLLPLVTSVIQYAWTFFYLRLEEIDQAGSAGQGHGPAAQAAQAAHARPGGAHPRLTVVEGGRQGG